MASDEMSELQRETLSALGRQGEPIVFTPEFVADLREHADAALGELSERIEHAAHSSTQGGGEGGAEPTGPPAKLWVSKFAIGQVLSCEAAWAEPDEFAWSAHTARGTICHRAVQLALNWRGAVVPGELVDAAMDLLARDEASLGDWLRDLAPVDRADVRSLCVELVSAFVESFPPLKPAWRPVVEARTSYPPTGPIVLSAKPDLTLGHAEAGESRKVIVDLKTGRLRSNHRDDLRYYALVETLVRRTPPRLLVTYSLESATPDTEAVSEPLLRSALRRTLDAIDRMIQIRFEDRDAQACGQRYCRHCGPGVAELDDADSFDPD